MLPRPGDEKKDFNKKSLCGLRNVQDVVGSGIKKTKNRKTIPKPLRNHFLLLFVIKEFLPSHLPRMP